MSESSGIIPQNQLPTIVAVTFILSLLGLVGAGWSMVQLRSLTAITSAVNERVDNMGPDAALEKRIADLEAMIGRVEAEVGNMKAAGGEEAPKDGKAGKAKAP